jgi:hypothetical protein
LRVLKPDCRPPGPIGNILASYVRPTGPLHTPYPHLLFAICYLIPFGGMGPAGSWCWCHCALLTARCSVQRDPGPGPVRVRSAPCSGWCWCWCWCWCAGAACCLTLTRVRTQDGVPDARRQTPAEAEEARGKSQVHILYTRGPAPPAVPPVRRPGVPSWFLGGWSGCGCGCGCAQLVRARCWCASRCVLSTIYSVCLLALTCVLLCLILVTEAALRWTLNYCPIPSVMISE